MIGGWAILIAVVALVLAWVFYRVGRYQVVLCPGSDVFTPMETLVDTRTGQTWRWDPGERAWVGMDWQRQTPDEGERRRGNE